MDEQKPIPQKINKTPNKLLIKALIGAAIIGVVAAGGFMLWKNDQLTKQNQTLKEDLATSKSTDRSEKKQQDKPTDKPETPAPAPDPAPTPTPAPAQNFFKPSPAFIENVTAVFNTLNTQPLEGHMASQVSLYYNSPELATTTGPTGATLSLDYFSDASPPWSFSLPKELINHYKTRPGFEKLFGDGCLTGRSVNAGHIVSLCFTEEGKIHSIFLCRETAIFN